MKRFFGILLLIALAAIFLPLLAILLFAFPLEFAVSTWHNLRIDSATKGAITDSSITHARRGTNQGSSVNYTFTIDDTTYDSSRWSAGLFSNSTKQAGGGEFAKTHSAGTEVDVYYDSSDPSFSMLTLGWPKWSMGFSMGVWGLLTSYYFKRNHKKTTKLLIMYPLSRALLIVGIMTIVLFPPTINYSSFPFILVTFAIIALFNLFILLIAGSGRKNPAADKSTESKS